MINNFLQITATHKFDFITIFSLTVPVFIGFIIFTTIYFFRIDKMNSSQANYYKSHGLSRFCLAGIFFLFGLIIFDLNFEFILGYLTQYINTDNFNIYTISKLENSILFKSLTSVYKTIPINILINFTIICTAIYTSTEGIIASLKTLKVEPGLSVELPLLSCAFLIFFQTRFMHFQVLDMSTDFPKQKLPGVTLIKPFTSQMVR